MNTVREKKRFRIIFAAVVLTLVVLACYSTASYAASGTNSLQNSSGSILDPFNLNTILTSTDDSTTAVRPPVRITVRPVMRSYYRPPMVTR